jgi:hypothetical protein
MVSVAQEIPEQASGLRAVHLHQKGSQVLAQEPADRTVRSEVGAVVL